MLDHGKGIHRYAIRAVSTSLIPHDSNLGMVRQIGARLGIPQERVLTRIVERGNTSSASIPSPSPTTLGKEDSRAAIC